MPLGGFFYFPPTHQNSQPISPPRPKQSEHPHPHPLPFLAPMLYQPRYATPSTQQHSILPHCYKSLQYHSYQHRSTKTRPAHLPGDEGKPTLCLQPTATFPVP